MTASYTAMPIEGVSALNSLLSNVKWSDGTLFLDFSITDQPMVVRATMKDCSLFRVLSDSYIPEEEAEEQLGLGADHLVYTVEGAYFEKHHSPSLFDPEVVHYRFVTGPRLVDVLSKSPPVIKTLGVSK